MKHIMNNATEGLAEPWVAYKEGVVYYKDIEPIIPTKVWYKDGTYKEYDIEGALSGTPASIYPSFLATTQIDSPMEVTKCVLGSKVTSLINNPFCTGSHNDLPTQQYNASLTEIVLNNKVSDIELAFLGCQKLTSVTIPDSVTSIGRRAFSNCTGLTSIIIPNSVTSIGSGAFISCTSLSSIIIPDSVTSIGQGAFIYCTGLTSVTIPDSVTSIGANVFGDCTGLTSITMSNSITSISGGAFSNCTSLTLVTIPNSVTSIDYQAFYGCSSLTSVTIPNSVINIGSNAFYNCTKLNTINYIGTKEQWSEINKGIDWCNHVSSRCIIHCTDGNIPISET